MFFSKRNNLVDKSDALVGRNDPIEKELFHEINGRNLMDIPKNFEIQIRPRSGLAAKHQISVLNTPGTIDADYRGELKVILINLGVKSFLIENGARIAQMVVCPIIKATLKEVKTLEITERGSGGFGSTGTK